MRQWTKETADKEEKNQTRRQRWTQRQPVMENVDKMEILDKEVEDEEIADKAEVDVGISAIMVA